GEVPDAGSNVVVDAEAAGFRSCGGNLFRFAALNAEQHHVSLVGAEMEHVEIVRVLIAPDESGRFHSRPGPEADFRAQVSVLADHFVKHSDLKFKTSPGTGKLGQHIGVAGRCRVPTDNPIACRPGMGVDYAPVGWSRLGGICIKVNVLRTQ